MASPHSPKHSKTPHSKRPTTLVDNGGGGKGRFRAVVVVLVGETSIGKPSLPEVGWNRQVHELTSQLNTYVRQKVWPVASYID
jgi:hypothetical protein